MICVTRAAGGRGQGVSQVGLRRLLEQFRRSKQQMVRGKCLINQDVALKSLSWLPKGSIESISTREISKVKRTRPLKPRGIVRRSKWRIRLPSLASLVPITDMLI